MFRFLLLWFWLNGLARAEVLPTGGSVTLSVPGLTRAAVADGKVARVRAVPPDQLFVSGLSPGKTQVTAWGSSGKPRVYSLEVLPSKVYQASLGSGPPPVVKIELQFLEVDVGEGAKYGLKWPDTAEGSLAGSLRGDGASVASSYAASAATAKGVLEALVTEGHAKVLSRPRLYVRLGESVDFLSGGEFPVPTSTERDGHLYPRIEWKSYGLSMRVKPESGDGVHLSSDVEVDVSETDGSVAVNGVPSLNRRKLTTKMESLDGETVLLSGLIRRVTSKQREGVPVLSSIPLLGVLFSTTHDALTESEIVIALALSFRTKDEQERELTGVRGRVGLP